jgi:mannose-1-phosphate guanylyltransferase
MRTSVVEPAACDATVDWTLALAGGDGVRLAEYVHQRFGRYIPKQYCAVLGRRTMLEHTLDRLNTITPASRTLTVIGTTHGELAAPQLEGRSDHVFRQPVSLDTGVALYVGLAIIRRWAPHAIVTITPTDHYVSPAGRYLDHLRAARRLAARLRDVIVILGVSPTYPEPDFGYLRLAGSTGKLPRVSRVVGFVEKPSAPRARQLMLLGALWNTMVMCGTIEALWELGRATEPELIERLELASPSIGTRGEESALRHLFRVSRPVSFSRDMVERAPERLVALELDGVEWSDWGRPERIEAILERSSLRLDDTHRQG